MATCGPWTFAVPRVGKNSCRCARPLWTLWGGFAGRVEVACKLSLLSFLVALEYTRDYHVRTAAKKKVGILFYTLACILGTPWSLFKWVS